MSRLYDTVEPAVVDEDMLQKAVEEQGPKEEAGKIAKDEGIDLADVKSLRLDFKSKLHGLIYQSPRVKKWFEHDCSLWFYIFDYQYLLYML